METERNKLSVWSFLKGLFKVVIGLSLLAQSLLFLVFLVFMISIAGSISAGLSGKGGDGPSVTVPEGGALVLNPTGVLVETAPPVDPFEEAVNEAFGAGSPSQVSVHELVKVVRAAKDDDRIKAMVLDLQGLSVPAIYASKAHYLAAEIEAFRESGKRVIAIGDYYTQEQYLIASEADTVLMHDFGAMLLEGYGRYRTYYKSAMDKLMVTSNVFRVGTYKSALEPYLLDGMSPAAKEANAAYLNVLWGQFTAAIEENRGLTAGSVAQLTNETTAQVMAAGGDFAQVAVNAGFVDSLMDRTGQVDFVADIVGRDEDEETGFRGVGYKTYLISVPSDEDRDDVGNVAVVTAAGAIVDGDEPYGVASGTYIARQLRDARVDEDVKAVVLRVDSPGGSAFASEVMRDELVRIQEAGKPVVVSMGSLAASGGYWISATADEIWASPSTVTGSIGVFGFIPTFEKTMAEVGIYTDGVGTSPLAAARAAGIGPLPEAYGDIIQASVEQVYDRFLSLVADGRGMTTGDVDNIAQGRVWIGETALTLNLVDKLGTIDDAIAAAAAKAELEEYDVVGVTKEKNRFEMFLEQLAGGEMSTTDAVDLFGNKPTRGINMSKLVAFAQQEAAFYASFNDPSATYLRCMECVER